MDMHSGKKQITMGLANRKSRPSSLQIKLIVAIIISILLLRATLYSSSPGFVWLQQNISSYGFTRLRGSDLRATVRRDKFLEIPQLVWGLNNQKIALARGLLTGFLNRTLLMPSLSASLAYSYRIELLQPMHFDKIFDFEKFNLLCDGFVQVGRYSDLTNRTRPFKLRRGKAKTKEEDLNQLEKIVNDNKLHDLELVRAIGKNPFYWHDQYHWPVRDYAEIFECLVLINEIENDVAKVISKIREVSSNAKNETNNARYTPITSYVAVHMRIETDWMEHCMKWEQRTGMNQICSSKDEILERVSNIKGINRPVVVYIAVADSLLEDDSILKGWKTGVLPYEKKRLGVWEVYRKHPYIIQSTIDFEVCLRADIFVGNSFSTFSGLVVLSRTHRLLKSAITNRCDRDTRLTSYAYNILGDMNGSPKQWMTDMSDSSLQKISYGSNDVSCYTNLSSSL